MELKIKRKRYPVIRDDYFEEVSYVTQYTNNAYTLYINESQDDYYVNVVREDTKYPNIYSSGVNVHATGTLNMNELDDHIQRLKVAKETYEQIFKMFKGIRIK